jgi:hypothetical protein
MAACERWRGVEPGRTDGADGGVAAANLVDRPSDGGVARTLHGRGELRGGIHVQAGGPLV